jgi:hypothetical protein
VLLSTVPAHRMCQTLPIAFIFVDAGLHPDERSSASTHRACAQKVLDVIYSFCILGCWPPRRWGSSVLKYVPAQCAQSLSDVTHRFLHFGMLACTQMKGQVLSSTVPAHRTCQTLLIVFAFMDAGMHPDAGSSALKYRAVQGFSFVEKGLLFDTLSIRSRYAVNTQQT